MTKQALALSELTLIMTVQAVVWGRLVLNIVKQLVDFLRSVFNIEKQLVVLGYLVLIIANLRLLHLSREFGIM